MLSSLRQIALVALIFHVWRVVYPAPPAAPVSEYDGWRGKAYIDDTDMLEIGNWITHLSETQMEQALEYYWVNNEIWYPYGAMVRSMFSVFNVTTNAKFSQHFLRGVEVIIHYILLKSFPVVGRRGGIRGTGQDKVIIKAAVPPLMACYKKVLPDQNFTTEVFPMMKRRKKRRAFFKARKVHKNMQTKHRGKRSQNLTERNGNSLVDSGIASTPQTLIPPEDVGQKSTGQSGNKKGRYTYALSHGTQQKAKVTNIVVADIDDKRFENIGVTIFWLIYELIPVLCQWTQAEIGPYKAAFDKIIGLVVSMYLYDSADYAEEYERIFNMTTPEYEAEWVKIETFAKKTQQEKKLAFTKPYSETV